MSAFDAQRHERMLRDRISDLSDERLALLARLQEVEQDRDLWRGRYEAATVVGRARADRALKLRGELEQTREALREALDLAAEGWSYAGDHFREKWNFEADLARLRALASSPRAQGQEGDSDA